MSTKTIQMHKEAKQKPKQTVSRRKSAIRHRQRRFLLTLTMVLSVAVVALGVIFWMNNTPPPRSVVRAARSIGVSSNKVRNSAGLVSLALGGQYPFQVGQPAQGVQAPALALPSTTGGTFTLAAQRGKTVLLYFQEGVGCEPCWDQLRDIQAQQGAFHALGIDEIVSITTDPLSALKQKAADEGITLPLLSDATIAVSQAYHANQYGMMGLRCDGHSFLIVSPNGTILWRADYGGAPNYTMYLPVPNLLADMRAGLGK